MTMDLFLWRHAQAEDAEPGGDDLARCLTPEGEQQAQRMAHWLGRHLPTGTRILCSPARRCEQTVRPLGRPFDFAAELAPGTSPQQVLALVRWPRARQAVLAVGHQPTLGECVARLLQVKGSECSVRKGSVWWLRTRERDGQLHTVVMAVQSPDTV